MISIALPCVWTLYMNNGRCGKQVKKNMRNSRGHEGDTRGGVWQWRDGIGISKSINCIELLHATNTSNKYSALEHGDTLSVATSYPCLYSSWDIICLSLSLFFFNVKCLDFHLDKGIFRNSPVGGTLAPKICQLFTRDHFLAWSCWESPKELTRYMKQMKMEMTEHLIFKAVLFSHMYCCWIYLSQYVSFTPQDV